jgi:hypothetical protein
MILMRGTNLRTFDHRETSLPPNSRPSLLLAPDWLASSRTSCYFPSPDRTASVDPDCTAQSSRPTYRVTARIADVRRRQACEERKANPQTQLPHNMDL